MDSREWLTHPLLEACGVEHGFGQRNSVAPPGLLRPTQVHRCDVASVTADARLDLEEADAVVSTRRTGAVGIVTADCVPILAATANGDAVAAIHAGWRGLAAGVVARGLEALRQASPGQPIAAVVGPRIGPCCYEVDAPVLGPLEARFAESLDEAISASRAGHHWLDLARLVEIDLCRAGVAPERCASLLQACTSCDPERFHSYRRDGVRAGRLVHYISVAPAPPETRGPA